MNVDEITRKRQKLWRDNNPEKMREYRKKYKEKRKTPVRDRSEEYEQAKIKRFNDDAKKNGGHKLRLVAKIIQEITYP